jgi:hypothetical protein
MAGYIDERDIMAKLQHITFSASSNPTITEVTDMIDDVEAEMDARFQAAGVPIPITDSAKIKVVTPIAINGVCAEVLRSIDMESEAAATRQELYEKAMRNIEKQPAILVEESEIYASPDGSRSASRPFHRSGRDW